MKKQIAFTLVLALASLAALGQTGGATALSLVRERPAPAARAAAWTPPIGIPDPGFGIEEAHTMYVGQTYDYNGSPGPYQDAGSGPYTHYVDPTSPAATDTNNPYGTATKPRRTFPAAANIQPGAVIEFHATQAQPYTAAINITSSGTVTRPIFFRGPSPTNRPVLQGQLTVRGHYIIVENVDFDRNQATSGAVVIRPYSLDEQVHHVSIRNCEARNLYSGDAGNTSIMEAVSYIDGHVVHDIVYYNNHIHPDDMVAPPGAYEKDTVGIYLARNSERVWVVDNHIHHLAGDCVGGGHASNYTTKNYYIGRNILHDSSENAIDLKEVENIVVSQNTMYNFTGGSAGSGGGGTAVVVHYGPTYSARNTWVLFNEIYSTNQSGIRVGGGQDYPVYIVGNIIHDIHDAAGAATAYRTWDSETTYFLGNIFYDVDNGIDHDVGSTLAQLVFHDNIIANVGPAGFHMLVGDSVQRAKAEISHNLFFQPGGEARIDWGGAVYDVAEFQVHTGKCAGCLEADPLFVDPANADFRLQPNSPAIDAGVASPLYALYAGLFGVDIQVDYAGAPRPQGDGWDIGAYEFVPALALHGAPANQAIHLAWTVNITLPITSTWQIDYYTTTTAILTATDPFSATRAYTLTGLTNYVWYTVTLNAMLDSTPFLTDTVRVRPTDRLVYLPLVLRGR